jgi:hypothetical protein
MSKRDVRIQRADHRRRTSVPAPPAEAIERELREQLTPAVFAQARASVTHLNLRDRKLNLAAMTAIVLSIVSRQIPSLSELLRTLKRENLLWLESMEVSLEALSNRFETLPAELFAALLEQMIASSRQRAAMQQAAMQQAAMQQAVEQHPIRRGIHSLQRIYTAVLIADGSTLEQLRKTSTELRQQVGTVLGGRILLVVDALRHTPMACFFQRSGTANDKSFNEQLIGAVPIGGLVVLDLGFFSFGLFDHFSDSGRYFVTRMREKVAYRSVELLSHGPRYRDEIIEMGLYWSNPCEHRVRMVSVRWGRTWYRYLSNELDAKRLSARQIAELYRTRWRVEEAFALTKRLLGLSYLWVGGSNGVEIQVYATLIIYSALIGVCDDVAEELQQPIDRISVEMVFRGFYHYSRAQQKDPDLELIPYLCSDAKGLGLIKAERKRHRQRQEQLDEIWQTTP